jgi:hypothetical protein
MSSFPHLLVATEFPPNAPGGGAAIVRQMLKEWPAERLSWWSCRPDSQHDFGQRAAHHAVAKIPRKLYPNRRLRGPKCWVLDTLWAPGAERHFLRTVVALRPDVVWVIPHGWSIPPLARAMPAAGVPFHLSIHDYPDVRGWVNCLGADRCRRMADWVDELYRRANTRDTVCREMSADIQARTGAPGDINHTGLEADELAALDATQPVAGKVLRIAYAGTIIVEPEFALFVAAMEKIRARLPRPVSLDFFGDHSYQSRPWFNSAWMMAHGTLPQPELSAQLRQCTWGFSPMALTDDDPRYNRFSLPTKLVSYLAAGLPVIALGHPESTVVKMATAYPVGLCSTANEVDTLATQLLTALAQPAPGVKYRAGIRQCALAEFNAARLRGTLYESLKKSAAARRGAA